MKKVFAARKVNGVWVMILRSKAEFESEQKFSTFADCVEFCAEMNREFSYIKIMAAVNNANQLELPL